jgi:NAD(P)-dependent dehydrogenase (short-subunit alcohol dehydrogenase family)
MAYSWAKRTLISFVHGLGLTLASHSIRINGVHPTNVNTDMLHHEDMYRAFRPDLENPTREDAASSLGTLNAMTTGAAGS